MRWASAQVVVEHEFAGNRQWVVHHCLPVQGLVGWDALIACEQGKAGLHGGRDDSILSAKLIRIAPETSSF